MASRPVAEPTKAESPAPRMAPPKIPRSVEPRKEGAVRETTSITRPRTPKRIATLPSGPICSVIPCHQRFSRWFILPPVVARLLLGAQQLVHDTQHIVALRHAPRRGRAPTHRA